MRITQQVLGVNEQQPDVLSAHAASLSLHSFYRFFIQSQKRIYKEVGLSTNISGVLTLRLVALYRVQA